MTPTFERPDPGTALGLAMIARERRERELNHLYDNFFTLETLAHRLNAESGEYFPPLAARLLAGTLSRSEKARVAIFVDSHPLPPLEYEELQSYFEDLEKAVRHE